MKTKKLTQTKFLPNKFNYAVSVVTGIIFVWCLLALLTTLPSVTGLKMLIVESGSMEKAIHIGSVILIQKQQTYQPGEIVTFSQAETPQLLITHRVYQVKETKAGERLMITKGDANDAEDSGYVTYENILGKVLIAIPFLGYAISFTKTLPGLIMVIIIPSTIVIFLEIQKIIAEVKTITRHKALTLKDTKSPKNLVKSKSQSSSVKKTHLIKI